jgi:hypothetical protein
MKRILLSIAFVILALLPLLLLSGCAQTVLYDRATGKAIARFQGDMSGSHYADGGTVWNVDAVNHSTPALAQGKAAAHVIHAVGTAGSGLLLSAGSSGLFPAAAAVAVPAAGEVIGNSAALPSPTTPAAPVAPIK